MRRFEFDVASMEGNLLCFWFLKMKFLRMDEQKVHDINTQGTTYMQTIHLRISFYRYIITSLLFYLWILIPFLALPSFVGTSHSFTHPAVSRIFVAVQFYFPFFVAITTTLKLHGSCRRSYHENNIHYVAH